MTLRTSWRPRSDRALSDFCSMQRRRVSCEWRAVGDQEGRNIARVRIAQFEIRHGRGDSIGLRILQPGINPLARGFVGNVFQRRRIVGRLHRAAVGQFDGVTMHAAISPQQIASQVQLRRAG